MLQRFIYLSPVECRSALKLIFLISVYSRDISDGNEGNIAADGTGKGAQSLKKAFELLEDYAANKVLLKLVPLPGQDQGFMQRYNILQHRCRMVHLLHHAACMCVLCVCLCFTHRTHHFVSQVSWRKWSFKNSLFCVFRSPSLRTWFLEGTRGKPLSVSKNRSNFLHFGVVSVFSGLLCLFY